jgi:hypothetical protein
LDLLAPKERGGVDIGLFDLRNFPMPFFDQPVTTAVPDHPPYGSSASSPNARPLTDRDD